MIIIVQRSQVTSTQVFFDHTGGISAELANLVQMHKNGDLSDAEFERARTKLLGQCVTARSAGRWLTAYHSS